MVMGGTPIRTPVRPGAITAPVPQFRLLRAPVAEPPLWWPEAAPRELADHVGPASVRALTASGGPPRAPARMATAGPAPASADAYLHARRFVVTTLRSVFEVLDRRRPARHLATIASGTVVDVLGALADASPVPTSGSAWGRVHIAAPRSVPRPARRGRRQVASGAAVEALGAEIFLTYTRGDRVLAAAGRVELGDGRWRWVAFTTAA